MSEQTTNGEMIAVLFLCTGNSARSQMAEAWTNQLKRDEIRAYSAGVEPHGVNHYAVRAMAEAGLDISGNQSKTVDELPDVDFDYVVTLCGHAAENCPFFPAKVKVLHKPFEDPVAAAKELDPADEEAILEIFRKVRDEIETFVEGLPGNLAE